MELSVIDSMAIGFGLTAGYMIAVVIGNLSRAYIQKIMISKALQKKAQEANKPGKKLCLKCKKNERPSTGLYCNSCQFSGKGKF